MGASLKKKCWEDGRSWEDREPTGVPLACEGLVCIPEIYGGFYLCEKGSGVVLGFFHWTHTPAEQGRGAAVCRSCTPHQPWLPDLLQGEETKSFNRTPPTLLRNCNFGGLSGRSGCTAPRAWIGGCPSVAGVRCFTPLLQNSCELALQP